MIDYIKPKCMPFYYNEQGQKINKDTVDQYTAYTTDGYLLPCCWCDAPSTRKDFENLGLYKTRLKLSNNDLVEDIMLSQEWEDFVNTVLHSPEKAPTCCREKCGEKSE